MTFSKLTEQYYDWLYKIVCGEWEPRNLSFNRLLMFLYNRRFIPACEMPGNGWEQPALPICNGE